MGVGSGPNRSKPVPPSPPAPSPSSAAEAAVGERGVSPVATLPPNTASGGAEAPAAVIRSATFRSLQREPGRINFAAHTLTGLRGSIFGSHARELVAPPSFQYCGFQSVLKKTGSELHLNYNCLVHYSKTGHTEDPTPTSLTAVFSHSSSYFRRPLPSVYCCGGYRACVGCDEGSDERGCGGASHASEYCPGEVCTHRPPWRGT